MMDIVYRRRDVDGWWTYCSLCVLEARYVDADFFEIRVANQMIGHVCRDCALKAEKKIQVVAPPSAIMSFQILFVPIGKKGGRIKVVSYVHDVIDDVVKRIETQFVKPMLPDVGQDRYLLQPLPVKG